MRNGTLRDAYIEIDHASIYYVFLGTSDDQSLLVLRARGYLHAKVRGDEVE